MVRIGFAKQVSYPPNTSCDNSFASAQREAERKELGLWKPTPTPVTPTPVTPSTSNIIPYPQNTPQPQPTNPPQPQPTNPPAPTQPPNTNCHPSYPDVCIPFYPPDLDCKDIPYRNFRVTGPDPHGFDGDHDGWGCEW